MLFRTLLAREEEDGYQNDDTDNNGGVGQVKNRPPGQLHKVRDLAESQAVRQIANGAPQLHSKAKPEQRAGRGLMPVNQQEDTHANEGGNDEEDGLVWEEAKGRAGVIRAS